MVTGLTDSQVSQNVVVRGLSTSFPFCCVAMELAVQLEKRAARLNLEWCPRELNQEADDLTNGKFEAFDPNKRVEVDLGTLPFVVLPDILAEGTAFYTNAMALRDLQQFAREQRGPLLRATEMKRKPAALRVKEPWQGERAHPGGLDARGSPVGALSVSTYR